MASNQIKTAAHARGA
ncbi:hypothetical protein OPV22_033060, partial [Ensete ventricosum]